MFRKLTASVVCSSVLCANAALASPVPPRFRFPAAYGTVRAVGNGAPRVLHIQDVHQNVEAQANIARTLTRLIESKRVDLIALEGAFTDIDVSRLRAFPDTNVTHSVATYLLGQKQLSGPMYAALTATGAIPPLVGVDDAAHYAANVRAYLQAAPLVAERKARLARWKREVDERKRRIFPSKLREFDRRAGDFHAGRLPLEDFIRSLDPDAALSPALRAFVTALRFEATLDFSRVESERARLFAELTAKLDGRRAAQWRERGIALRSGALSAPAFYAPLRITCERNGIDLDRYPAVAMYLRYLALSGDVDAAAVFADMNRLEAKRYRILATTPAQRALVALSRRLALCGKLVDFSLSSEEWSEYARLQRDGSSRLGLELSAFERFYAEARRRDDAMAKNLLREMKRRHATSAVLVTGGFHADGVDALTRRAGVHVAAFVPRITRVDTANGSAYLGAFAQEKTPLAKLFEGKKLFLSTLQAESLPPVGVLQASLADDPTHAIESVLPASNLVARTQKRTDREVGVVWTNRRTRRRAALDIVRSVDGIERVTSRAVADSDAWNDNEIMEPGPSAPEQDAPADLRVLYAGAMDTSRTFDDRVAALNILLRGFDNQPSFEGPEWKRFVGGFVADARRYLSVPGSVPRSVVPKHLYPFVTPDPTDRTRVLLQDRFHDRIEMIGYANLQDRPLRFTLLRLYREATFYHNALKRIAIEIVRHDGRGALSELLREDLSRPASFEFRVRACAMIRADWLRFRTPDPLRRQEEQRWIARELIEIVSDAPDYTTIAVASRLLGRLSLPPFDADSDANLHDELEKILTRLHAVAQRAADAPAATFQRWAAKRNSDQIMESVAGLFQAYTGAARAEDTTPYETYLKRLADDPRRLPDFRAEAGRALARLAERGRPAALAWVDAQLAASGELRYGLIAIRLHRFNSAWLADLAADSRARVEFRLFAFLWMVKNHLSAIPTPGTTRRILNLMSELAEQSELFVEARLAGFRGSEPDASAASQNASIESMFDDGLVRDDLAAVDIAACFLVLRSLLGIGVAPARELGFYAALLNARLSDYGTNASSDLKFGRKLFQKDPEVEALKWFGVVVHESTHRWLRLMLRFLPVGLRSSLYHEYLSDLAALMFLEHFGIDGRAYAKIMRYDEHAQLADRSRGELVEEHQIRSLLSYVTEAGVEYRRWMLVSLTGIAHLATHSMHEIVVEIMKQYAFFQSKPEMPPLRHKVIANARRMFGDNTDDFYENVPDRPAWDRMRRQLLNTPAVPRTIGAFQEIGRRQPMALGLGQLNGVAASSAAPDLGRGRMPMAAASRAAASRLTRRYLESRKISSRA
jgi:hypothetical protein